MTAAAFHLWSLLRAHVARRDHDRHALAKRRLENLLRSRGMSRIEARDICWHYFND